MEIQQSSHGLIFMISTALCIYLELQITWLLQISALAILFIPKTMVQLIYNLSLQISVGGKILFVNSVGKLDINIIRVSFDILSLYQHYLGKRWTNLVHFMVTSQLYYHKSETVDPNNLISNAIFLLQTQSHRISHHWENKSSCSG